MTALPESITSLAYRASHGELAWRRSDIPAVLNAIAASGYAVLGGEVWVALGKGQWHGMVTDRRGGPPGVWHWDTTPRTGDESWPAYCSRVAEESARVVVDMRVEEESAPEVLEQLFFNLTYVAQAEAEQSDAPEPPVRSV